MKMKKKYYHEYIFQNWKLLEFGHYEQNCKADLENSNVSNVSNTLSHAFSSRDYKRQFWIQVT